MARVNISIPDELADAARSAGLNVSELARAAITAALDRREKAAGLDRYLAELDVELGASSEEERADAARWAEVVFGERAARRSA